MNAASERDQSKFSSRPEASRALHELTGMLRALILDHEIEASERKELEQWLLLHRHLSRYPAFRDVLDLAEGTLSDGAMSVDEVEEVIGACRKFEALFEYYDEVTAALQVLEGLLHGIVSDGKLKENELKGLLRWTEEHRVLSGIFPFDEVHAQVQKACTEGTAGAAERFKLMRMIFDLVDIVDPVVREALEREVRDVPFHILYDSPVNVAVRGRSFCITGRSSVAERRDIASRIAAAGGRCVTAVSGRTDYLVIGSLGDPFWAHARYGRKLERAKALRKEGRPIQIIREEDLWKVLGG